MRARPRIPTAERLVEIAHADPLALAAGLAADTASSRRATALNQAAFLEIEQDDAADPERLATILADLRLVAWEANGSEMDERRW